METIKGFRFLRKINEQDKQDTEIAYGVLNHLAESQQHFKNNQIIFIALQGSQNYKLNTPTSDIDTKLILVPSLNDLIFNKKAVSTTHIRRNNEHTDWKDIRLMFNTFRKQNLNFIEILYSPWIIVNKTYWNEIKPLFENRDLVGFYCKTKAVQTMKGIALNKYDALKKNTPSHQAELEKFGYSPKELHHLIRITNFMAKYITDAPYEECMVPNNAENLIWVKQGGLSVNDAQEVADRYKKVITELCDNYIATHDMVYLPDGEIMLQQVQKDVMRKAIKLELR